ncbi:MAG TPA: glucosidase [Verrucomicrobiae bacterium]|nr:glucosidase [Verrucomicrobiae bacterium]
MTAERQRLAENHAGQKRWKRWGPYLSERQWGTVREDYSPDGTAWEYFPHDHARSRAYRWGEDGIAGVSDNQCRLCLSLALWNGKDPILKERLFGVTNSQGNHGEDVKELYYYLDATPTHSYLKMLYKYPQREYPYCQFVEESQRRKTDTCQPEFELLDTGIFDDDRYWDVFVEYAKADESDILMRITAHNRGPEPATLHVLPQLWFRNTWSWDKSEKPVLRAKQGGGVSGRHAKLGECRLDCDGKPELLFCDNETNVRRLYEQNDAPGFFKDAFHEYVVNGNKAAVNPQQAGTKAAAHYTITVPAGGSETVRLRLVAQVFQPAGSSAPPAASSSKGKRNTELESSVNPQAGKPALQAAPLSFGDFDSIFSLRLREADEFYGELQKDLRDEDARRVQRQALVGMIWSKQFYHIDIPGWIKGDPAMPPPPPERKGGRNADWQHLNNADVISMPDKWEYPWYAAWDLAFHCIPFALIDAEFAKHQLVLLTREWYMHPNGQLPAYEWAFGDVNPPVHAWAAWRVFQMDRKQRHESQPDDPGDLAFLERVFHKLMLNFTWWVNRKDTQGRNIFQGGFLGLDNIGVFDRSAPLPTGGHINQADGTSWMAMYSLNLMRIALELARHNKVYEDIATKFFEHFLSIAAAINSPEDGVSLWDSADEFYYDQLRTPGGREIPLKVRSMVGLIPLFAVETIEPELLKELPEFAARLKWVLDHRPELASLVSRWEECGVGERSLLSLLRGHRMKCLLHRMLDETEFLSQYGVRAVSKIHEKAPFRLVIAGMEHVVNYWPGESENHLFGGNSNWRGPLWMPVNFLIIESLQKFYHYYGDDFKVECPTGSGKFITIKEVANELTRRLCNLFLKGADGQRPVLKYHPKLAGDPQFKDYILFHEYFHGDTGRGAGASHQTGWTGLVAKLLQPRRSARQLDDTVQFSRPVEKSAKKASTPASK